MSGDPFDPDKQAEPTEVSSEVLDELSRLFGGDDQASTGEPTVTEVIEVVEIVESFDDGSVGTTVVEIIDPDAGSMTAEAVDTSAAGPALGIPPANYGDPLIVIDIEEDPALHSPTDVDPRFEERRRVWARKDRLKRVRWLKLAGLVAAVSVVLAVILASPLFAIRSFTMEGNVYTSSASINKVRRILKGTSIFTADTSRARSVLLADPWVAEVRITTRFPSSVVVEVSERTPVVWYVGTDDKARMVDARGRVIDVLEGFPTKYLQVKGTGPAVTPGEAADDAYRAAAQLVLALPDELRPKVTALDLSPAGELSMVLKGDTLVRFGSPTDLQNKLVAVVVLLRRQDPATISVIDVSAGDPTVLSR